MTGKDRGLRVGFSPLAGVTAGTAGVLFAFGVLCLAWHQVSGHVSAAVTVLFCAFVAAFAVVAGAVAWLAVLWVAARHRNPDLLVRQVTKADPPPIADGFAAAQVPPGGVWEHHGPDQHSPVEHAYRLSPAARPAIEPPRVYLNVTPDELAALMMRHDTGSERG